MIGFFDSGLGGLTILKEVVKKLPDYSYVYLGDNARTPYGSKSQDLIYKYTLEGVQELFKRGAVLVVLACNTASSVALRKIQQEFLPKHYPSRKVLGIIIPTTEEISKFSETKNIGILATEATIKSMAYAKEINKIFAGIKVFQQACPLLVPIMEAGEKDWEGTDMAIEMYLSELFAKCKDIDTIILGCTHYSLIEDKIKKYLPSGVKIILQGEIIADKLSDYLKRHHEIKNKIDKTGKRIFLTTENSENTKKLFEMFFGGVVNVEKIDLS